MKKILITIIAFMILLWGLGIKAHATLIEMDLVPGSGDKYLTIDTKTGLEWLDLTLTLDMGVYALKNGAGGWYPIGFRHATASEVETLFIHAGIKGFNVPDWTPEAQANYLPALTLIGLFGETYSGLGYSCNAGITEPFDLNNAYFPQIQANLVSHVANATVYGSILSGIWPDGHIYYGGNYLVRPVPEPSTFLLVSAGLVGLFGLRKKFKN